jgi:predicted metal-binding membrane protein
MVSERAIAGGQLDRQLKPPARSELAATATALTATLGLAATAWVVAVRQMDGMDMGVATQFGSFPFFVALWAVMMTAMMLPGAAQAVLRRAQAGGRVRAVSLFVGSYLAVWTLVGVAVYAFYRPHTGLSPPARLRLRQVFTSSRRSSSTSAGAAARAYARDSRLGSTASARASD